MHQGKISIDLMNQAIKNNKLTIVNPLDLKKHSFCQDSFKIGIVNYLRFKANEIFYIIQCNFTAEALFFPERQVFIHLPNLDYGTRNLNNLIMHHINNVEFVSLYLKNKNKTFGGFIIEHSSPFHIYMHKLPILYKYEKIKDSNMSVNYVSDTGKTYIDIVKMPFISFINKFSFINKTDIENLFFISIGERSGTFKLKEKQELNNLFLKYSLKYSENDKLFIEAKKLSEESDIFIWLGITTGKREWIEQEIVYIKIIQCLSFMFSKVSIVFDGWTDSHEHNSENDLYSKDTVIMNKLVSTLPNNVNYISLIGSTPEQKVSVGSLIDFFSSNNSQGSLWISKICKKRGVTHTSNLTRKNTIAANIHYHTYLVPEELVKDIEDEKINTIYHKSYSINENKFVNFFMKKLLCNK